MGVARLVAEVVVLVLSVLAGPAYAGPAIDGYVSVDEFAGYIHFCEMSSGGSIVETRPDGTIVSMGKKNTGNRWVTGLSIIDGTEENTASAEFNPELGTGSATLLGRLSVDNDNGHWLYYQKLRLSMADGDSGHGIAIGAGAMLGKLMLFETGVVEEDVDSPCGPTFSVPLKGIVVGLNS